MSVSGDWMSQTPQIQPWSIRFPLVFDPQSSQSTLDFTSNPFSCSQHGYVFDNRVHHFCFRYIQIYERNEFLASASLYPLSFIDDEFESSVYHAREVKVDEAVTKCSNNVDVFSSAPPSQDHFNCSDGRTVSARCDCS